MTQKELLYIEDAIGHENTIIDLCNDMISNLEDKDLVTFTKKQMKSHIEIKDNLICLLEDNINE